MSTNWTLQHEGFALLRTPLLPYATLAEFESAPALADNLQALAALAKRPEIRGAIANASAGLASRMEAFDPADQGAHNLKLAFSLYKYIARMSSRCTPFGVMASVSTLPVREGGSLELKGSVEVHARLDNHQVARLARHFQKLLIDTDDYSGFRVRTCNTLYRIGGQLRYVLQREHEGANLYSLAEIDATETVCAVTEMARDWISIEALQERCCSELDCSPAQAREFLHTLLQRQVLRTELDLVVTAGNCLDALLVRAERVPQLAPLCAQLRPLAERFGQRLPLDAFLEGGLEQIAQATIGELLPDSKQRHWVQADTYRKEPSAALDAALLQTVLKDLAHVAPYLWLPSKQLEDFTKTFSERYGDAEVPLLEALDADTGIAIGPTRRARSPLLKGVMAARVSPDTSMRWGPWDQFLMDQVLQARAAGRREIELKPESIDKYRNFAGRPARALDDTYSLHLSLLRDGAAENGPLVLFHGMHGPSALSVLGRFTNGDPELCEQVRGLAEREQARSGELLAEVVHAPQGRLANICARPVLREVEIAYGAGASALPESGCIAPSDLHLRVEGGRLKLRSASRGCDVQPRLASAHNTSGHNLPVYQFLTLLQRQSGSLYGLRRSEVFDTLRFQPRIRYGCLILQQATWLINSVELRELNTPAAPEQRLAALAKLRAERDLPRFLCLSAGDNILEVDLDCALSSLTFIGELADQRIVSVTESMRALEEVVVSSEGAALRNELFVPVRLTVGSAESAFATPAPEASASAPVAVPVRQARQRRELPLQQWLYLELYTGEATAELLLTGHLKPALQSLAETGDLRDWFFVRYYSDRGFHLRLRARAVEPSRRLALLDALLGQLQPLMVDGLLKSVRIEGYEPEVERYGGPTAMPMCEQLFCERSGVAANVLAALTRCPDRDEQRWLCTATMLWDQLLLSCDSLEEIERFAALMYSGYRQEMPGSGDTTRALSDNYRAHGRALEAALQGRDQTRPLQISRAEGSRDWRRSQFAALRACTQIEGYRSLLSGLLHMDCNRMFAFDARANEMVVYEYLARFARSIRARGFEMRDGELFKPERRAEHAPAVA